MCNISYMVLVAFDYRKVADIGTHTTKTEVQMKSQSEIFYLGRELHCAIAIFLDLKFKDSFLKVIVLK